MTAVPDPIRSAIMSELGRLGAAARLKAIGPKRARLIALKASRAAKKARKFKRYKGLGRPRKKVAKRP